MFNFFFSSRRRHTRLTCDWSSDVCSSDLNKGEVAAELLTDFPERLTNLREAFVGDGGKTSALRPIQIKACWLSQNHPGQAVFHFEGCTSINDAEKYRGQDVFLPIEQRVSL